MKKHYFKNLFFLIYSIVYYFHGSQENSLNIGYVNLLVLINLLLLLSTKEIRGKKCFKLLFINLVHLYLTKFLTGMEYFLLIFN